MKPTHIFMQGEWKDLIMTTFEVDKSILEHYVPKDTEIDLFNNKAYLSMVAFTFSQVKFFGIKIPCHQLFPQINFRFYVKSKINGEKGVVFIKEFAPKRIIATVAKFFYNEPYYYKNIKFKKTIKNNRIELNYSYKSNKVNAIGQLKTHELIDGSLEKFVVDRHVAFIKNRKGKTFQYKIFHQPWTLYHLEKTDINEHILKLLPKIFKNLKQVSTCFVNGSSVEVQKGLLQ